MTMTAWPELMTLRTAAAYLDYKSTEPIEELLRNGKLSAKAITTKGDRRIRKSDLDRYIASVWNDNVIPFQNRAG